MSLRQIGLGLIVVMTGCAVAPEDAGTGGGKADEGGSTLTLQQRFTTAVADARVAEASEVWRGLVAIVPEDPDAAEANDLVWRDGKVLVVTWTSWTGYDSSVGQAVTATRETWVTAVPEVQVFCQGTQWRDDGARDLRLEQRLGLPPNNGKTRFVELWVSPADLFRPCGDAEITDTQCDLDVSSTATEEHTRWFEALKSTSYGERGYPWTRLGYTYDWSGEAEVGASEFVIRAGTMVGVEAVETTKAYCGG